MPKFSLDTHTARFAEIVQRFARRRSGFKVLLPGELARIKDSLDASHLGSKVGRVDYQLMFSIAVTLARQPEPVTMSALSRALDVPLSTATRLVDWLVNNGYVERRPDPGDRRIVQVCLTDAGRNLCQIGNEYMSKRIGKWMRHFTSEERETLIALMSKLADVIENEA